MKIAFFEINDWEERLIREVFPADEVFLSREKVTSLCFPDARDFEVISIFIDSRIDGAVLDCFPNLKLIATRSTGYDHIDIQLAKSKNVAVAFVPGYGDNTVAEFAFGLLLSLTRKIYPAVDQIKERGTFSLEGLRGMDLQGKTMGVVGTGRIGREVIKIANGFGLRVLAYDPYPNGLMAKEMSFTYVPFDELLKNSDIVSIHCPYNKETHHLINQSNVGLMKKGAYLVNTARGGIVETQALVDALDKGILAGAALDVIEEEGETKDELDILRFGHPKEEEMKTMLQNHILMRMPNVLVTPHMAFNSQEALERILRITLDNIKRFSEGTPANLVP